MIAGVFRISQFHPATLRLNWLLSIDQLQEPDSIRCNYESYWKGLVDFVFFKIQSVFPLELVLNSHPLDEKLSRLEIKKKIPSANLIRSVFHESAISQSIDL